MAFPNLVRTPDCGAAIARAPLRDPLIPATHPLSDRSETKMRAASYLENIEERRDELRWLLERNAETYWSPPTGCSSRIFASDASL
jgi:hypothetical protein